MRVRLLSDEGVPEHIVQGLIHASHPPAERLSGGAEHTFERVGEPSDGKNAWRREGAMVRVYAADPSEDQTSILVRTRSMTALVKSLVLLEPPRSGVLIPEPTVSSADS
jgi:hypothetical protein